MNILLYLLIGVGIFTIGFFFANLQWFKEDVEDDTKFTELDDELSKIHQALAEKLESRIKTLTNETDSDSNITEALTNQVVWNSKLIEKLVKNYEIDPEKFHNIVKEVNDEFGIETPSFEETSRKVEEFLKNMNPEDLPKELRDQLQNEDLSFTKTTKVPQELSIDLILDKISKHGKESLTKLETEFLEQASKK